jgi:hypothetical protein
VSATEGLCKALAAADSDAKGVSPGNY